MNIERIKIFFQKHKIEILFSIFTFIISLFIEEFLKQCFVIFAMHFGFLILQLIWSDNSKKDDNTNDF